MNTEWLDWIVTEAKEVLLKDGVIHPHVFVELDHERRVCIQLPQYEELDDVLLRNRLLFFAGRDLGKKLQKTKKDRKSKVTSACTVSEVWYLDGDNEEKDTPRIRPSRNPHRKEGLCIVIIDANSMKQGQIMYQILRDGSGALVDLLQEVTLEESEDSVHGPGLPSFLAGARTAKQDQSQAIHEFRRTYDKYSLPRVFTN